LKDEAPERRADGRDVLRNAVHYREGVLTAPDGKELTIRSAWFASTGENTAHLVAVYPLKRKSR